MTGFFNRLKSLFTPVRPRRGADRSGRQRSCRPLLEILEDRHAPASLQISGAFNMDSAYGYLADIVGHDNSWTASVSGADVSDAGWDYDWVSDRYVSTTSVSGGWAQFVFSGPDADLLNAMIAPALTYVYFDVYAYDDGSAQWYLSGGNGTLRAYADDGRAWYGSSGFAEQVWGHSTIELSDSYSAAWSDWDGVDNFVTTHITRDAPPPPPPPPPPTISIADVSVQEGNKGTRNAWFTVSLSEETTQTVTVNYATADGTATLANNDYLAANGTLTFSPGQRSQTITVKVKGDKSVEAHETFFVNLTSPTNATIADAQGVGTILSDDGTPPGSVPAISISDVYLSEGYGGQTSYALFTVSLSQASSQTVTVNFATADGTATVADNDYQPTSGTLTFAPGETSKTISVLVIGDDKIAEGDDWFAVNLSSPLNAVIADGLGVGTIVDDEGHL